MSQNLSGLSYDQKNTTHPIACVCNSTGDAEDIFDGLTYGKGACFLHQLVFFLGQDVLKEGLKTYFQKYKFKNTEAKDFLGEMAAAAQTLNVKEVEIMSWSKEWLESAGCSSFDLKVEVQEGCYTKMQVSQTLYNAENTPLNRLRKQKF